MQITLSREEGLACIIALERNQKHCKWEKLALGKLIKAMGLSPSQKEVEKS